MSNNLYPDLAGGTPQDLEEAWREMRVFAGTLKSLLELRDTQLTAQPAIRIVRVVTVSDIGLPVVGDVSYSTASEKFRGYTTTSGWVDLN